MQESCGQLMETKAKIHDISIDFETGKQVISLVCEKDIRGEYDRLKDKECRLKVVQYREGRSLDANAYFHVLVGKIAEVMDCSKVFIKNKMIAEYGQYEKINGKLITIPLDDEYRSLRRRVLSPTTNNADDNQYGRKDF